MLPDGNHPPFTPSYLSTPIPNPPQPSTALLHILFPSGLCLTCGAELSKYPTNIYCFRPALMDWYNARMSTSVDVGDMTRSIVCAVMDAFMRNVQDRSAVASMCMIHAITPAAMGICRQDQRICIGKATGAMYLNSISMEYCYCFSTLMCRPPVFPSEHH